MLTIIRNRTLRPSSRKATSPYKIDTRKVGVSDILQIRIFHESNPDEVVAQFELPGREVASKNSIHFTAIPSGRGWSFRWSGANPRRM